MRERQVPLGINTAVGAATVVVCCLAPGGLDAQGRDARLAVLTVGVAVFAAAVGDLAAVAVTAGVAFLLFDGFVEGRYGDLVWTGRADVVHVALLYGAGLLGVLLGAAHGSRHRRRGGGHLPVVPGQRRVSGRSAREQRVRNPAGR